MSPTIPKVVTPKRFGPAARDVLPRHGRAGRRDRRGRGAGRDGRAARGRGRGRGRADAAGPRERARHPRGRRLHDGPHRAPADLPDPRGRHSRLHGRPRRGLPAYFPNGAYPPNTLLVVSRLVQPELLVEIEAMAVKPAAAAAVKRPGGSIQGRPEAAARGRRRGSADDRGARALQRGDLLRGPPRGGRPRRQGRLLPRRGLDHLRGPAGAGQPHRQRAARSRRAPGAARAVPAARLARVPGRVLGRHQDRRHPDPREHDDAGRRLPVLPRRQPRAGRDRLGGAAGGGGAGAREGAAICGT